MDKVYDDRYHLHLGYYEDNCDYESVAFKRQTEDIWDIILISNSTELKILTRR